MIGFLRDIEPKSLSKAHRGHPWQFAYYDETGRDDGLRYKALLFRDKDRKAFGIIEWLGPTLPHQSELRDRCTRIVTDKSYRDSLISDDPDLPRMWKGH